mmetsp:Transcript_89907/g.290936  ORF Transcript_89907/g.290936 Transcript_89907/m.290936 type:complete len:298 (-) Transcript_89907:132-1025(-)
MRDAHPTNFRTSTVHEHVLEAVVAPLNLLDQSTSLQPVDTLRRRDALAPPNHDALGFAAAHHKPGPASVCRPVPGFWLRRTARKDPTGHWQSLRRNVQLHARVDKVPHQEPVRHHSRVVVDLRREGQETLADTFPRRLKTKPLHYRKLHLLAGNALRRHPLLRAFEVANGETVIDAPDQPLEVLSHISPDQAVLQPDGIIHRKDDPAACRRLHDGKAARRLFLQKGPEAETCAIDHHEDKPSRILHFQPLDSVTLHHGALNALPLAKHPSYATIQRWVSPLGNALVDHYPRLHVCLR